jgi:hypothetical protein
MRILDLLPVTLAKSEERLGGLMGGLLTSILLALLFITATAASTAFIRAESRNREKPA